MKFGAASDIGLVREINQDSHYIPENPQMPLFMVADGMGGHNAGEIASVLAINSIKEWMKENSSDLTTEKNIQKSVVKSIEYANRHIYNYSKKIDPKVRRRTLSDCYFGIFKYHYFQKQVSKARINILKSILRFPTIRLKEKLFLFINAHKKKLILLTIISL